MSRDLRNHGIFIIMMLTIVLSTYFVVSTAYTFADTSTYSVKVTSSTLNVRSGPGVEYALLGKLTLGQTITATGIVSKSGVNWYKFTYQSKTAYVSAAYTKLLSTTTSLNPTRIGQAIYTTNVRSGPSTASPSVAVFTAGQKTYLYSLYTIAGTTTYNKWYRVNLNGKTGYVIANFVTVLPTIEEFSSPKIGVALSTTVYRSSPDAQSASLGTLTQDSEVTLSALVTAYSGSTITKWYRTEYNGSTAYVYAGHITIPADNFEAYLTAQGFPESYKPFLRALHADNPKWIFKAQATGLDWNAVLLKEQKVGTSLLAASTSEAWKSFEDGAYDFTKNVYKTFDTSWNAADSRVVAYYLDPRNFLNETAIYQFMDHKFDAASQTTAMIRVIAAGSFLNTDAYATLIYNSGQAAGVNPNVITSIIRQEQGTSGTSGSISGTYPGYEGYYNHFNIGAYTTSTMNAIQRGLWWAKGEGISATTYGRPWNTPSKSITGGSLYYKANYLDKNQNTFYLKKFNVMNGADNVATHQYMTHILAAANEGISLGKAYIAYPDYPLIFYIPVYNNMPASPVAKPGTTGNNDNVLNSLKVINPATEGQYTLTSSTGSTGFSRYTTGYSVTVPSSVSQIIINGIGHNNTAYASANYATTTSLFSNLPTGFKNAGTTTNLTTVTVPNLLIYSGTGTTFSTIGSYANGIRVTVLDSITVGSTLWYKVSYNSKIGYIDSAGTNKIQSIKYYSAWLKGTTTADLNVRASASTSGTLLGSMSTGMVFYIFGDVVNPDGSKWYIMSYYGAPVYGNGVYQLAAGTNVIKVTVKATTGVTRTYTITVKRT